MSLQVENSFKSLGHRAKEPSNLPPSSHQYTPWASWWNVVSALPRRCLLLRVFFFWCLKLKLGLNIAAFYFISIHLSQKQNWLGFGQAVCRFEQVSFGTEGIERLKRHMEICLNSEGGKVAWHCNGYRSCKNGCWKYNASPPAAPNWIRCHIGSRHREIKRTRPATPIIRNKFRINHWPCQ